LEPDTLLKPSSMLLFLEEGLTIKDISNLVGLQYHKTRRILNYICVRHTPEKELSKLETILCDVLAKPLTGRKEVIIMQKTKTPASSTSTY